MMKRLIQWFTKKCNKNHCTCFFDSFKIKLFKWEKSWNWSKCCKKHDDDYINNQYHNKTKWQVDAEFFKCVRRKTFWLWALIMWLGNQSFSWYAWDMYKSKEG